MDHITVIASILAIAVDSLTALADKPARCADACKDAATPTVAATALLSDGSTIKGDFLAPKIKGSTAFIGNLALNPAIVKSITFSGTNNEAKVALENGDRFTMRVRDKTFTLKSVLGILDIPRRTVRSLALAKRRDDAKCADAGLVFYCTFDDEAAVTTPKVGPQGTFLQGDFMQGKVGMAMQTTVYSQNATFELPANFFGTSGCIEFWAKILKPSSYIGNGGDPRLFTITQKSTNITISTLDIVSNNGGGNSGFATWTFLGNMASVRGCRSLRYEDLFPTSNFRDWHHYAIVWDTDGIADLPCMVRQ